MAYKTTSRPIGVVGGGGERRAMGDSSHYEEIALIGNGQFDFLVNLSWFLIQIFPSSRGEQSSLVDISQCEMSIVWIGSDILDLVRDGIKASGQQVVESLLRSIILMALSTNGTMAFLLSSTSILIKAAVSLGSLPPCDADKWPSKRILDIPSHTEDFFFFFPPLLFDYF